MLNLLSHRRSCRAVATWLVESQNIVLVPPSSPNVSPFFLRLRLRGLGNVRAVQDRIVNQSQVPLRVFCICLSRPVVQDDLGAVRLARVLDVEAELRVGDRRDPGKSLAEILSIHITSRILPVATSLVAARNEVPAHAVREGRKGVARAGIRALAVLCSLSAIVTVWK